MRSWRSRANLTQADAATRLGLVCRRPQAYLSQIETGKRPVPDAVLVKVSEVYGVPPEQVLLEAYGYQLPLPLYSAVSDAAASAAQDASEASGAVVALTESDCLALARFAGYLAFRRTRLGGVSDGDTSAGES